MKVILFTLLVIFACVLDIYLSTIGINPTTPAYSLLPMFFGVFILRHGIRGYSKYLKSHTAITLLVIVIFSIFFSSWPYASTGSKITDIVNSIISFLFYLFTYKFFSECSDKELKVFLTISLSILIASLVYDNFVGLPGQLEDELRKGGFSGNPNIAGSTIKFLGFCLLYLHRHNKTTRWIVLTILLISVFMTFSRSGMLGIALILFFLMLNEWKSKIEIDALSVLKSGIKLLFAFSIFYFILLTATDYLKQEIPALNKGDAGKRIDLLLGKSKGGSTRDDEGSGGRKGLLYSYIDKFKSKPWGHGTAYTSDKRLNEKDTHNFYLKMAVTYGVFGLMLIILFILVSVWLGFHENQYYYLIFTLLFMIECIASHSVFIERPTLIAFAFMDSILYSPENKS